jgi:hypothetical protein
MALSLWSEEYERKVIQVLVNGPSQGTKTREEYHLFSTFKLSTMADVQKVIRRKNNKFMATENRASEIIAAVHVSLGEISVVVF